MVDGSFFVLIVKCWWVFLDLAVSFLKYRGAKEKTNAERKTALFHKMWVFVKSTWVFLFAFAFFFLLFTSHKRLGRRFHISNTTKYDFRRQQKNALTAKYEPICHLNKRNAFVCQTYRMANVVFIRSLIMLGKSTWCSAQDDFLFLLRFFSISWRTIYVFFRSAVFAAFAD